MFLSSTAQLTGATMLDNTARSSGGGFICFLQRFVPQRRTRSWVIPPLQAAARGARNARQQSSTTTVPARARRSSPLNYTTAGSRTTCPATLELLDGLPAGFFTLLGTRQCQKDPSSLTTVAPRASTTRRSLQDPSLGLYPSERHPLPAELPLGSFFQIRARM